MLDLLKDLGIDFLSGKDKEEFTLKINNTEISVLNARVLRSFDTTADTWSATVRWDSKQSVLGSNKIQEALKLNSYYDAQVYLGGHLILSGRVYSVSTKVTSVDSIKELEGFTYTIDIVDSSPFPPYEFNLKPLHRIAKTLLTGFGIEVVADPGALLLDIPFVKVVCDSSDTIFSFLAKLAKQRSIVISSNAKGNLLLTTANIFQKPVGTIVDGKFPGFEYKVKFDGRKLFGSYMALASSPGRKDKRKREFKTDIAVDHNVPSSRRVIVRMDDSDIGVLINPIENYRSKQLVEALTLEFPVVGWYAPDGSLWAPNTLVTVRSEYLELPQGYTFFIRAVEYRYTAEGNHSILHLVPKESYTGGVPVNPWERNSSVQSSLLDEVLG